jgi:MFS family permease
MIVSLLFPLVSKKLDIKKIALIGLSLYTFGGAFGAFATNIYFLLFTRILLGMGVGLIMPLSTGLLGYYFDDKEQKQLMGYSVAMNNLGGVIAMSLSGFLASMQWNYSFYVYLLGLFVLILVIKFLPKDYVSGKESNITVDLLKKEFVPLASNFLVMFAYYAYITNFSILVISENIIDNSKLGIIMSFQAVGALSLALVFGKLSNKLGENLKYVGIFLFMISFVLLLLFNTALVYMIALFICGAGMGILLSYINASAIKKVDKILASSAMAMLSVAMYSGQFLSPIISNLIKSTIGIEFIRFPYVVAIMSAGLILLITAASDLYKFKLKLAIA